MDRRPPPSAEAPIGVFDSGIGGLSVLRALRAELPGERFVYLADSGFAPYGERGEAHAIARAHAVIESLRSRRAIKALVVACNTATTAAIHLLRAEHPELPLIGVEPAVKPALAQTRTGRVGVIGTRGTVGSAKFAALVASLAGQGEVVVQACDGLAKAIEDELLEPGSHSQAATEALCREYLAAMGGFGPGSGQIDTLVLGCTHYVFAQAPLLRVLGGAAVQLLENGEPVARHTRHLLAQRGLLATAGAGGIEMESTGDPRLLDAGAERWLGLPARCVATA
ncbi:glutamate racemase [Xylophilus rhododendri]|uniref:Glutamate racemase n=1 Tax=Xylophilus rhododendri TaxID=2697032 RepID=A0A857J9V0_9BURK|nr:glutamate racemase [Xylophilus rhododendri]QHJ00687.1 glutamate racemase [Xylophilus rhododendri]